MVPEPVALIVDLGADLVVQPGETAVVAASLSVPPTALETLVWEPATALSCTGALCLEQEIAVTVPTEVWLTAIDTNGCQVTDRVLLSVQIDKAVYIPNVFSPDGDGENDNFTVYANPEIDHIISLQVYERWGAQVFHRENFQPNDPFQGWNGRHRDKPLDPDVFVYWTKVRFKDGTEQVFKGDVTLIR